MALRFGPVAIFGVHGTSPAWGVNPRLTTVNAVTETCQTPWIQDREIHSFNLTYYTARDIKNWALGNFWRPTGSPPMNTFK